MPDGHIYCDSAHAGSFESQLTIGTQHCSIMTTVDVPQCTFGRTTLEELSLHLRDAFYDSLDCILPDVSSSPQLVLDAHHFSRKSLKIDCSLPAQLVPSLAEALMLSKALTTALALACHRLDCLQYGFTMLLNCHTTLVKNISAAKVSLCTVEGCCLRSQASGRSVAQERRPSHREVRFLKVIWFLQK